jgi:hypothetical protein
LEKNRTAIQLISFLGFPVFPLLVRTLPKREVRMSGRRRARFPFAVLGYLVITGAIGGGMRCPGLRLQKTGPPSTCASAGPCHGHCLWRRDHD